MRSVNIDSAVIAGLYLEKLVQIGEEEGVCMPKTLSRLGLSRNAFYCPTNRFSFRQFYSLVEALEDWHHVAGVGFKLGRIEGPLTDGFVGYACSSAATLRQSILTYIRFVGDLGLDIQLSLSVEGNTARLSFSERYPLGRFIRVSVEEIIGHLLRVGDHLRGGKIRCTGAAFSYCEPDYAYMYADILRCPISFQHPTNRLCFDKSDLDLPLLTANEAIYRICVSHCETLYRRLGKFRRLADEIKRIVINVPSSAPKLDDIARQFNMTPRSLRRHLSAEKTSYQGILYDARMSLAADYLKQTAASPREISYSIGYQEVASFYHNFRRWSGRTPKQYREENNSTH